MLNKIKKEDYHQSQRGYFAGSLYNEMINDSDIFLVVGDLGYKVFDNIIKDFPERFINTGSAEFSAVGICCGLAQDGRKPFFYSITTFLLYRPFEILRTYINHEKLNVKLVGSGRDRDYEIDGFSHDASDVKPILNQLSNIKQYWPNTKEEIPLLVEGMVKENVSSFISLRR